MSTSVRTIGFPAAFLAKSVLFFLLLYVLINRLFIENDVHLLCSDVLHQLELGHLGLLGIVILLMPLNWSIEVQKLFVLQGGAMTWPKCLKSVLCGVSLGVVTPARVGEYGGRLLVVAKRDRGKILISTFLMSLAQLSVSLCLGGVAFLLLIGDHPFLSRFEGGWILGCLLVFLGLGCIGYLLWPRIKSWILNSHFGLSIKSALAKPPTMKSLGVVFSLSGVRYIIYLLQYAILFIFLDVDVSFTLLAIHIAVIFLIQSLLPLPPMASLVSRSSVAVLVLAPLGINEMVILMASISIWIINLMIPSFCGLMIILQIKTKSKT